MFRKGMCGRDPEAPLSLAQEAPISEDYADTHAEVHFYCAQLTVSSLHFTVWRQTEEPGRGFSTQVPGDICVLFLACLHVHVMWPHNLNLNERHFSCVL